MALASPSNQTFQLQQPVKHHAPPLELSVTSIATDIDDDYFFDDSITELSASQSHTTAPTKIVNNTSSNHSSEIHSSSGLSQEDMQHLVSLHIQNRSLSDHPLLLLPSQVIGYCSADPLLTISEISCTDTSTFNSDTSTAIHLSIMTESDDKCSKMNHSKLQQSDTELYGGPKPYFIKRSATESQLNLSAINSKQMKRKHEKHLLWKSKSSNNIHSPFSNDINSPSNNSIGGCSDRCTMNEEYFCEM